LLGCCLQQPIKNSTLGSIFIFRFEKRLVRAGGTAGIASAFSSSMCVFFLPLLYNKGCSLAFAAHNSKSEAMPKSYSGISTVLHALPPTPQLRSVECLGRLQTSTHCSYASRLSSARAEAALLGQRGARATYPDLIFLVPQQCSVMPAISIAATKENGVEGGRG
jgi:hypothetical protein